MLGVETIGRNVFCKRHSHHTSTQAEGIEAPQNARQSYRLPNFIVPPSMIAAMERKCCVPSTI